MSAISDREAFYTFNLGGQIIADTAQNFVSLPSALDDAVNEVRLSLHDAYDYADTAVWNNLGGASLPYDPQSQLFQNVENNGWGTTLSQGALSGIGGLVTGALSIPRSIYQGDYRAAGSDLLTMGLTGGALYGAGRLAANGINLPESLSFKGVPNAKHIQTKSGYDVNAISEAWGNLPPWKADAGVITELVPPGMQYQMVVSEGQAKALLRGKPAFGGFATSENITTQAFARDKLVILDQFKDDVSRVVTVETTGWQKLNRGLTGPLENYGGGVNQVEFLNGKKLKLVNMPRILPRE
jgi:hypothetical protein